MARDAVRWPGAYVELLEISDGMYTIGNLNILGAEGVVQCNVDYEVRVYLPDCYWPRRTQADVRLRFPESAFCDRE